MAANNSLDTAAKWLLVIGGLNWGLVGLGGFLKTNLNVIQMVLGTVAGGILANVVYVLVGVAAVLALLNMFKK